MASPGRAAPATGSRRSTRLARPFRSAAAVLGMGLAVALVAVAALADLIAPYDPLAIVGPPLDPPSTRFPMGTDDLGRDLLSGVIHGARTSLAVGAAVGALVLVIGMPVGLAAGFRGGLLDDGLMRVTELFQVIPRFFLAVVVIALLGPGLDRLIVVLGFTSWTTLARVVRAETLSVREREFVEAARAVGMSDRRIVRRVVLPHVLPGSLVMAALVVGQVLLVEASLAFLGLGDPTAISWGYLAGQAQPFLRVAWWLALFPGIAIVAAVLAFNLLADVLNDAFRRLP